MIWKDLKEFHIADGKGMINMSTFKYVNIRIIFVIRIYLREDFQNITYFITFCQYLPHHNYDIMNFEG